jgi:apolipoprotein N-acyltransferase
VRLRAEGLAALSGALLALSFPKLGHWAVGWLALAPLLIALGGADGRRGLRLGYVTGAVSAVGLLYWTSLVVTEYGGLSLPVGVAVMTMLCLAFALFPALFGWMVGRWASAFGPGAVLLAPLAWVATEILRNRTFFQFPWCLLGYSQAPNPVFIQSARFGGVYAVSFLLVVGAAALALLVVERDSRRRRVGFAAALVLLAAAAVDGIRQLGTPPHETGRVRVGLVQARILQDEKWDESLAERNVDVHVELTRRAVEAGARFVVWPESAVPQIYDDAPFVARRLEDLARSESIGLLFGNDDRAEAPGGGERYFVGVKMLSPEGVLVFRYHKIHLVPFGEYVPLRPLFTLGGRYGAKLVQRVSDFSPGGEWTLATVLGHPVGAFICYEDIFPELVRRFTIQGAELLVNVTNDAWYGRTSAPYQHLDMAILRAVENGRYLVRAANTGVTAVVDPRGRVLARTALFDRTVLVEDVPFVSGETPYVRRGDAFAWACLAAAAGLTAATFGLGPGRKRRTEPQAS